MVNEYCTKYEQPLSAAALVPAGSAMESRPRPPEGLAARANGLPSGRRCHETAVADRMDEQLHATCGGVFSHRLPTPGLAGRVPLVPGEKCARAATEIHSAG